MKKTKAQLGNLQAIITTLVVIGILLGVGFLVLEELLTQVEATAADGNNASSYEAVNDTIQAMKKIPTFLTIIVIIAVVSILLFLVFRSLPRGT